MKNDYRIHVTIRRRNESVFDSIELKTEMFDDLDEILFQQAEFTNKTILDDDDEREDDDDDSADITTSV